MQRPAKGAMDIEAELAAPSARVRLVHYHFFGPPSSTLRVEDKFRVELSLSPRHRTARACFRDHWNTHRFERIGKVFIVPPGTDVLARSDEASSTTALVCELQAQPILDLFDGLPKANDRHLVASLDIRDATVHSLLRRMADEAKHPGFASEVLVESIATQMSIELFRHGTSISERQRDGGLASWQLRLIDERLKEVRKAPSLALLARLCGISVRSLTRNFARSRGCTIGTYVAASQMEHAKDLLATEEGVSSIARTLGFSNCSNFCYAFRRRIGMTPKEFRQTMPRR